MCLAAATILCGTLFSPTASMASTPAFHGRALIVGVNHYDDDNIMSLHFSGADAKMLGDVLADPKRGIFDTGNVRALSDSATDADHKATRLNILKGVDWLSQAGPDDTILLYFSGHGAIDDQGSRFLVSEDSQLSSLAFTAVPVDTIKGILDDPKRTKARRIVIVFDSCHSGVRRGAKDVGGSESGQVIDSLMNQSEGLVTLSSCDADEQSFEDPDLGHGIFTYNLVQGLMGAADINSDGLISVGELQVYTRKTVGTWAQDHHVRQTPRVESNVSGDIILARDPQKWAAAEATKAAAKAEITTLRSTIEQKIGAAGELNAADGGLILAALDRLSTGQPATGDDHVLDLARKYAAGTIKAAAFSAELVALRPVATVQVASTTAPIKVQFFQPALESVGDDEYSLDCDAHATVKVVGLADSGAGMTRVLVDGAVASNSSLPSRDLQLVGAVKQEAGLRFDSEIHAGDAPSTSVITAVDAGGQRRLIQIHLRPKAVVGATNAVYGGGSQPPAVAVIGLARKGLDDYPELRSMRIGQGVQQILTRAAADTKKFTLVEEKSEVIDTLVKTAWTERSAAFDQTQAVEVGKLMGAHYVIYGQVYDFASPTENRGKLFMAIEVRMVDVQTGRYIPGYGESTLLVPKDDKGEADFDRSTLAHVGDTAIKAALVDMFKRASGGASPAPATAGGNA